MSAQPATQHSDAIAERDLPHGPPPTSTDAVVVCDAPHEHQHQHPRQRSTIGGCCLGCCALLGDLVLLIILIIPAIILSFLFGWVFAIFLILSFILFLVLWPFTLCCDCERNEPPHEELHEQHHYVIVTPIRAAWRWRTQTHN